MKNSIKRIVILNTSINTLVYTGGKMKLYNILAVLVLLKTIIFSKYLIQHICSMLRELDIILGDIVMIHVHCYQNETVKYS
jgi:L-arabinose isomerase